MEAGSPVEKDHDAPRAGRRWPLWVALSAAAIAAVAMVISLLALRSVEQDADAAEAEVASTTEEAGQLEAEVAANEELIAGTQEELAAMRALLQPGTPEALQAVYLRVVAAACADPNHDIDAAVADIAAEADTSAFPAQPGWEAAIDRDAVSAAMGDCEAGDG